MLAAVAARAAAAIAPMQIPLRYSARNLLTRKLTTALTAGGMALVVFVFAAVLMLDAGLRSALVSTGQPDNILVTRRAAGTEIQSGIERSQAAIVETQPEIAIGPGGVRMVSKETVVLIAQPKRDTGVPTNITVRGLGEEGPALRPQVRIASGRMFRRGTTEIVVGDEHCRAFRGDRHRRAPAVRRARVDRRRRVRRRGLGLRLRGLGRRRADDAVLPAQRLLDGRRAARRPGLLRRAQGAARVRSAPHARRETRAPVLRGAVRGAVELHPHPRAHAVGDLLGRRDDRGDDHDVRRGGEPHCRDRELAGPRFPARRDPRRVPRRSACALRSSGGRSASRSPR